MQQPTLRIDTRYDGDEDVFLLDYIYGDDQHAVVIVFYSETADPASPVALSGRLPSITTHSVYPHTSEHGDSHYDMFNQCEYLHDEPCYFTSRLMLQPTFNILFPAPNMVNMAEVEAYLRTRWHALKVEAGTPAHATGVVEGDTLHAQQDTPAPQSAPQSTPDFDVDGMDHPWDMLDIPTNV